MRLLFWASALMIGYVYVGYPLLLAVWAGIVGREGRVAAPDGEVAAGRVGTGVEYGDRRPAARVRGVEDRVPADDRERPLRRPS